MDAINPPEQTRFYVIHDLTIENNEKHYKNRKRNKRQHTQLV